MRYKGGVLMDNVKYEVEFGCCDGREGLYKGNTIAEIHRQIDEDVSVKDFEKDILKYGYFYEFKDKSYKTSNYVIDNGFHCMWKVNRDKGKLSKLIKKIKEKMK